MRKEKCLLVLLSDSGARAAKKLNTKKPNEGDSKMAARGRKQKVSLL
jgi:hypothetical protein